MGGEGDDSDWVNVGEIQRLSMPLNSSGVKDGMPVGYSRDTPKSFGLVVTDASAILAGDMGGWVSVSSGSSSSEDISKSARVIGPGVRGRRSTNF